MRLAFHRKRGVLGPMVQCWPCVMGVVVGLTWWIVLWPSFVGLAIVAAVTVLTIHK